MLRPGLYAAAICSTAWLLTACGSPTTPDAGDAASDVAIDMPMSDVAATDASGDGGDGALPDLTVDMGTLQGDLQFVMQYFAPNACELGMDEQCVGAPGWRRLLMFTTLTPNLGSADLDLGNASMTNPNFTYSTCHQHYHYNGYAQYSLLAGDGGVSALGHKQSFCVEDLERVDTTDPGIRTTGRYDNCGEGTGGAQGISRGWADDYYPNLPCQWIDVTDVAPGDYTLQVSLNYLHHFAESNYDNNIVSVPVTLPATWATTTGGTSGDPTRNCGNSDPGQGIGRDCDWRIAGAPGIACTPGDTVQIGCNSACGAGACSGNWQIRVCRGATTCRGGDADNVLQSDYGLCGTNPYRLTGDSCPSATFVCPPTGSYTVMVEPEFAGGGQWSPAYTAAHPNANLGYCTLQTVVNGGDGGTPSGDASTDASSAGDGG